MVAQIIEKNNTYYCSNCRMRVFEPTYNCKFCGNLFSNYEIMLVKHFEEEKQENESDISGRSRV